MYHNSKLQWNTASDKPWIYRATALIHPRIPANKWSMNFLRELSSRSRCTSYRSCGSLGFTVSTFFPEFSPARAYSSVQPLSRINQPRARRESRSRSRLQRGKAALHAPDRQWMEYVYRGKKKNERVIGFYLSALTMGNQSGVIAPAALLLLLRHRVVILANFSASCGEVFWRCGDGSVIYCLVLGKFYWWVTWIGSKCLGC